MREKRTPFAGRVIPWVKALAGGAIAGLISAAAMYALFLLLRVATGVPTPSEMFADRSAPYIPVPLFGILIGLAGGYTPLKIVGFTSVVLAALVVGAAGGAVAARRFERPARFVWSFAATLFAVTVVVFWPVLQTNYFGLPPRPARIATIAVLLTGYVVYAGVTLFVLRVDATATNSSRRRFLVGSVAGAAAFVGIASWAELFRRAAFSYDGQTVKGPGVSVITPNERFYTVTKNVTDPTVDADLWRLTVGGAVSQPLPFDYAQFTALPSVTQETTPHALARPARSS